MASLFLAMAGHIATAQTIQREYYPPADSNEQCINAQGQVIACGFHRNMYLRPDAQYPKKDCRAQYNQLQAAIGQINGQLWKLVEKSSNTEPGNPYSHIFDYPQFVRAQNTIRMVSVKPVEMLRQLSYPSEVNTQICDKMVSMTLDEIRLKLQQEYGVNVSTR